LPRVPILDVNADELPLWPPLLAARGPGSESDLHAHHAMHFMLSVDGELRVRSGRQAPWRRAHGVLTPPDVPHAIDARGTEVVIVFLDAESEAGETLRALVGASPRALSSAERDLLVPGATPRELMGAEGAAWTSRAIAILGGEPLAARRAVDPRVRRLLRLLRTMPVRANTSLDALARAVSLSPGRLMHVFTASTGIPLRPYLAWLRLQRAAAGISAGLPLGESAHAAGFADSAHMSRTFRRMFGVSPSQLRPRAARPAQPGVLDRPRRHAASARYSASLP
jgi:AraC-like DNA-binding protein